MSWDFRKLPPEMFHEVKDLVGKRDLKGLAKIHDEYDLSNYSYCCDPKSLPGVLNWFQDAIDKGLI